MSTETPMKIRLERIGENGLDLDEPVPMDWVKTALGDTSSYRPSRDGRLTAHLALADHVVHVRGHADVALAAECARCVEPVTVDLRAELEVALFPKGQEPPAGPDGELAGEDLGVSTYENKEIDLAGLIHDGVFLELPMVALCRPDCRGLCQTCGKNLNEGPCTCQKPIDDRWAALAELKNKLTNH